MPGTPCYASEMVSLLEGAGPVHDLKAPNAVTESPKHRSVMPIRHGKDTLE